MAGLTFPQPLGFNTGATRNNETGVEATVLDDGKTTVVASLTTTTDGSGNITALSDAAIVAGTFYRVVLETVNANPFTTPLIRLQAA